MNTLLVSVTFLALGEGCITYEEGVSNDEAQKIVDLHNDYRRQICDGEVHGQPAGVNLKKMEWDSALASAAQNIANSCVYGHQTVEDDRWGVGQNLFMFLISILSEGADWDSATQAWFDENEQFNFTEGFSSDTGHYTQMIWADTQYVGCGYSNYRDTDTSTFYNKYYVCNYGPAGNVVGESPYEVGDGGCPNLS